MVYSGNPTTSQLDAIRFWLQDTSSTPLLTDDEIRYFADYAAGYSADPILLAASLCPVVQAKYAGEVAITGDGITYDGEKLQDKYAALTDSLLATYRRLHGNAGIPWAGGIAEGCHEQWGNTRAPLFALGRDDNPDLGSQLEENAPYFDPANYQTQ